MTLKYKVGDRVRIVEGGWGISDSDVESLSGEVFEVINHLPDGYFGEDGYLLKPSILTRFDYTPGENGFIGGKSLQLIEDLQSSNESGNIAKKTEAVSGDNAQEVRTPTLEDGDKNEWFKRGELPPVGSKVIFYSDDFNNEGYWHNKLANNSEVEIIAHFATDGSETLDIAAFTFRYESNWIQVEQAVACCFRPIKTAEEIAEEERKKAINEMDSVVKSYGSWEICADLYDAGYRFVGDEK